MSTREKILLAALRLFSRRGYDAVSVEQIAQAVGIRAPSLYKHFKGKQDNFDAILTETAQRYAAFTGRISVPAGTPQEDRQTFSRLTADALVEKMRALGLDVPEMTDLAHMLRGDGVDVRADVLTVDEMVEEVCRLSSNT